MLCKTLAPARQATKILEDNLQKKWRSLHLLELLDGCSTIGESTRVNITDIIVNVTIFKMVEIMSMLLVS